MRLQDTWKIDNPKEVDAHTKSMNKNTYHWCIHHKMWTFYKSYDCEMGKMGIHKTVDANTQR